jgi:hypothetical protein
MKKLLSFVPNVFLVHDSNMIYGVDKKKLSSTDKTVPIKDTSFGSLHNHLFNWKYIIDLYY